MAASIRQPCRRRQCRVAVSKVEHDWQVWAQQWFQGLGILGALPAFTQQSVPCAAAQKLILHNADLFCRDTAVVPVTALRNSDLHHRRGSV